MLNAFIDSRYEIKETLGEGGMGIVYKAYDSHRTGFVALKTMKDVADPAALELFTQEWRTLANVSHPNIVDVFNSGEFEEDGQRKPYFVMPLLPGRTLDKLIRDSSHALSVERVVDILVQTCRGLQAAHDHGLIHRDLKPSNLFVLSDDSVKIIDFGMVHLADAQKSATGVKGTLQYMAPEQLDMKDVSPATDIFALGIVAYESLTGRKPFDRGSQQGTVQAIRNDFPPPASNLNPAVNRSLSQVVAKALAKAPWSRFGSAREFAEYLQKAAKDEPIELFDAAKIQPRVERARRALKEGDIEFATEILNDLQVEGRADSEISLLLEDVRKATGLKVIRQLLDTARMRLQEDEFPLAWQKVQEALQKDPGNTEAQALQAEIETRRSDEQVEKWRRLVLQHLQNHAFTQARQAIEEIRKIKNEDLEISELLTEVEDREAEFRKACEDKELRYQSAMRTYDSGEISVALSKLQKILEPDSRAPGFIGPGRDGVYRETYNRIRSEWEAVGQAVAEIEQVLAGGNLARAAQLSKEQCSKYPNDLGLQALKIKVDDRLRQEKSAYIAEVGRRLDAEPDLDRGVSLLEEAIERYPKEPHFLELVSGLRRKRDLVESIATKARHCEEQNLAAEALNQWKALRTIYAQYPGLDFEIQRVQNRLEHNKRGEEKLQWVEQIDRLLQTSQHDRALELAIDALTKYPADQELESLKRLAQDGRERGTESLKYVEQAQGLCVEKRFGEAINLLRLAVELDPNNATVRTKLADALASHAQIVLATDWRAVEPLVQEALRLAPSHPLAKSLRPSVLLAKRMEYVDGCIAQARELQAAGDINGALAKVHEGLTAYPGDNRLVQLQITLRNTIAEQGYLRRNRDLEEIKQIKQKVDHGLDESSLSELLDRSVFLSKPYVEDQEFSSIVLDIRKRAVQSGAENVAPAEIPTKTMVAGPAVKPAAVKSMPPSTPPIPAAAIPAPAIPALAVPAVPAGRSLRVRISGGVQPAMDSLRGKVGGWKLGSLTGTQQAIAAGIALVATVAIIFIIIASKKPRVAPGIPPVSVTFSASPDDAAILVDGQPLTGKAETLKPGTHLAAANKLGFKTVEQQFTVETKPTTVALTLEPEPLALRISADLPGAKILLDGAEAGPLQDNTFSREVAAGAHTLKAVKGSGELFSVAFQAEAGVPARLTAPPAAKDLPIVIVSRLGSRAVAYSSLPEMRVKIANSDLQSVPPDGRELALPAGATEIVFDDGKKPISVALENSNAPLLSLQVGAASKGTVAIEANVDGAQVFVNGTKKSRAVQRGKWFGQFEPGEYKVRIVREGYDDPGEQKITVTAGKSSPVKFELKQSVTNAFLHIEGGTPEAEVMLDGQALGKLDASGSLASTPVKPDVEHTIRIQKENYEAAEFKRHAAVKQNIQIGAAEAHLKAFGTLVLDVQPAGAQVTVQRQGESAKEITARNLRLREGTYSISAKADGFDLLSKDVKVISGQSNTVTMALTPTRKAVSIPQGPTVLTELFRKESKWTALEDGFWSHEGTAWFKDRYFTHTVEMPKPKRSLIKQEKYSWRVFLNDNDYIEYQLDDSSLYRKQVIGGKPGPQQKMAHKGGGGNLLRITISVQSDHVAHKIGELADNFPCKVEGPTGFDGRFSVKLIK